MRIATPALVAAIFAWSAPVMSADGASQGIQTGMRVGTQPDQMMATKITVADIRRSYEFYTQALGLKVVDMPGLPAPVLDDPQIDYTDAKLNFSGSRADPFLILRRQKGLLPSPEHTHQTWLVIKTADVRAAVTRARQMGVPVQVEPRDFMGIVIAVLHDPDGYSVELMQTASMDRSQ